MSIRVMQKNITLAAIFMLAATSTALAGGKEGSIGAGAEIALNGTGGVSLNYDAGKFHFGGFLGFNDDGGDDDTDYTFGARFYYHVHETTMSDFGVGGGISFLSVDQMDPIDRTSELYFEPGFQFRAFVANNVALSFTAGFSFGANDASGVVSIDGQVTALAGVHYYFFK